jgi:hypothetical protein
MSSFAEIRDNLRKHNPGRVRFRRVKRGSLSRNHIGFRRSSDGYAYVNATISPSTRFKIEKQVVLVDYERPEGGPQ